MQSSDLKNTGNHHITETSRLQLRELTITDTEDFFHLNADPEVLKYTGDRPFSSMHEAQDFIKNYTDYRMNGYGRWAVILKSTNEFLGWCGLKLNEEGQVDLGFRLYRYFWGQGYATEAARASLEYGFQQLQLSEIIGRASEDNLASHRVLLKSGMQFWKKDTCEGIGKSLYFRIVNPNK